LARLILCRRNLRPRAADESQQQRYSENLIDGQGQVAIPGIVPILLYNPECRSGLQKSRICYKNRNILNIEKL